MASATTPKRSENLFNKVEKAYIWLHKKYGARLLEEVILCKETSEETCYSFDISAPNSVDKWRLEVSKNSNMDADEDNMIGCTYEYLIKVTTPEKQCYLYDNWHKSFAYINKQFVGDLSVWKGLLLWMQKKASEN